jgi:hypothetical protein
MRVNGRWDALHAGAVVPVGPQIILDQLPVAVHRRLSPAALQFGPQPLPAILSHDAAAYSVRVEVFPGIWEWRNFALTKRRFDREWVLTLLERRVAERGDAG